MDREKMSVFLMKRFFQMVGQWGALGFLYTMIKNFNNNTVVFVSKVFLIILATCIGLYYLYTTIKMGFEFKRTKRSYIQKISNKNVKIGYEVGSFWDVVNRYKNKEDVAIILGINNRFIINSNFINSKSLVSNYIESLSESNIGELKNIISHELNDFIVDYDKDNNPIYSYGSLACINQFEQHHYEVGLLAMCEPIGNGKGKFNSTRKDLIYSFEKLFENMSDHYTEHTLIIPLIGTKSSGSPLSHEEVAKYLISAFANYTRISERRLAKGLIVSIYDKDLESMKHIMEVKRHIDMECGMGNFSYLKVKNELTQLKNSYESI